jgi:hypothetical protein
VSADLEVPAVPAPSRPPQGGGRSFFVRYLGRELGRRARQATVIALGLALGIGLVIVVSAAAAGVKNAQASVLHSLYGVGTDITITQSPGTGSGLQKHNFSLQIQGGPGQNPKVCVNGKCKSGAQTIDQLFPAGEGVLSYSDIAKVARLADVKPAGLRSAIPRSASVPLAARRPRTSRCRAWTLPATASARSVRRR